MRQYFALGVRYSRSDTLPEKLEISTYKIATSVTLTHTCNNAFAGSCGMQGYPIDEGGLTHFGTLLVREMNRIGMIVDISHTSVPTARDVLRASRAPPIFSHSNARAIFNVTRNIPDEILDLIQSGNTMSRDALVMATFAPQFVSESEQGEGSKATLERVAGKSRRLDAFEETAS